MVSLRQRLILSLAASLAFFFIVQTLMIGNEVEDLGERNLLSRLQSIPCNQSTWLTPFAGWSIFRRPGDSVILSGPSP